MTIKPPFCFCGLTVEGKVVLGGAFEMADTFGMPLWASLDQAEKMGCVISIPHYFASAMEHGWDDEMTFGKIRESLADRGRAGDIDKIKLGCLAIFMDVAKTMPGEPATEVGRRMKEMLTKSIDATAP